MRGSDERTGSLFSYVDIKGRLRPDHPLRAIRALTDETLAAMERELAALYSGIGRPSIAPQMLLRAMLLQAFYSVRSERQLESELRNAIDGEEHVDLAVGMTQLTAVDVDVTNRRLGEATAFRLGFVNRQPRDAVAFETSMQARSRQLGNAIAQTSHDIVERQQRPPAKGDHHRLFDRRQHRTTWVARPYRCIHGRRA